MYDLLAGMRVIEADAFIAGPSCALHLAQFGAEVIRIDPLGGGPDFHRWPLAGETDSSLYWEGLNKAKKSIVLNLADPRGRELAVRLITAGGEESGLFVTNFPADGFLSYSRLLQLREDLICVRIMGWPDGRTAVDYTVNAGVGVPSMTGPVDDDRPVNHVLPAWDLLAGAYAAFAMLAAHRSRAVDGRGREVRIPLSDLAIASLGHLGQIGEVQTSGRDRQRIGNQLYGAFGRDFVTRDARRVMVIAITARQWDGLLEALNLREVMARLETELGVNFRNGEDVRFVHRDRLNPLIEAAIAQIDVADLGTAFDAQAVCWSRYRSLHEALQDGGDFSTDNPMLSQVDHPSGYRYLAAGAAATIPSATRRDARAAPRLGRDTDEVLSTVLGMSASQIGTLHDTGLVAGP